ncbi:hypothetical protein TRAPUB_6566 [Trametes pubescens]|uniref:Uncharacterized protein n=1 Tax=Trametes pubescens TaxID=154538 RepID=A0A1M2V5Y6_TRAPU|nr:hypothetical protein TRAPUB_6566 [Trametes pubescens]
MQQQGEHNSVSSGLTVNRDGEPAASSRDTSHPLNNTDPSEIGVGAQDVTLGASTGVDTSNDDEYSIPPLEGDDPWPVQLSDEECLPLYQEQQVTPFSVLTEAEPPSYQEQQVNTPFPMLAEAEPPLYQEHQVTPPPLAEGESPPLRTQGQERF